MSFGGNKSVRPGCSDDETVENSTGESAKRPIYLCTTDVDDRAGYTTEATARDT